MIMYEKTRNKCTILPYHRTGGTTRERNYAFAQILQPRIVLTLPSYACYAMCRQKPQPVHMSHFISRFIGPGVSISKTP